MDSENTVKELQKVRDLYAKTSTEIEIYSKKMGESRVNSINSIEKMSDETRKKELMSILESANLEEAEKQGQIILESLQKEMEETDNQIEEIKKTLSI